MKALDYAFLSTGNITKEGLPESEERYGGYIDRYLLFKDAKLKDLFENLYNEVYVAGYYRGLIRSKNMIDLDFEATKEFFYRLGIEIED